jgi:nucleoside-diphosphate-sugar epimerase
VLVTGAGGFLGESIVEQLVERGDQVRGFGRGSYPRLEGLGVDCVRGDIRDATAVAHACRSVDLVIHAAAVAGIWGPWRHFYEINTLGTRNVLDGCRQNRVPRLVYTSSPSVTFDGTDQSGVDESVPYPRRWLCHYPHTKALAEQQVLAAHGKDGLSTCALRPHLIWGPRDAHLIPRLLSRARAGQLRRIGEGENFIDAVYVTNAATAHLLAADQLAISDSPVGGNAYFISNGEPVNCWDWINQILALAGLPPVSRSVSFRTAWRMGAVLEGLWTVLRLRREPPMTRFLAAQLARSHYFNIHRARTDLGYQPKISMAQGMEQLNEWLHSKLAQFRK